LVSLVPGDTLRILLVSTEEAVRNQVGDALAGRAGEHQLFWVSQPDLAPGKVRDVVPQIILLDDEALGARAPTLTSDLAALIPDVGVILLSSSDAMGLALQAVPAAARGFVSKPIDPDALLGAIREVLSQRGPMAEAPPGEAIGRLVVFCAPKSGTGRTTLAINTSISLQQETKQAVVLVDADYAAPAIDIALNLRNERDISELLPKMSRLDGDLISSVLAQHESELSVLLAPPPAYDKLPLSSAQVQQVLVWLRHMFPWVIVDLGLPLDEAAFAFLDSSDLICMSALPEMIGLRNTRLMFDQLLARGYPENKIWLILNRRGLPAGVKQDALEEWLGLRVRYSIPNDQELAADTDNRGVPFAISHKHSAAAKGSLGLAREIAQALPVDKGADIPIAPVAAARTAPASAVRRIGFLKPALAGLLGVLVVFLLGWTIFPSMRHSLLGETKVQSTPVAAVAAAATASAIPKNGTPSSVIVATENAEAVASPLAEVSATPMEILGKPTGVISPSPTSMPTNTPEPTMTWTPTVSPTPTQTATPTETPTNPAPTRAPTRPRPRPTPTAAAPALKAPSLGAPGIGETRTGVVTFTWQPAGALPPGTAYEVVTWNAGEDPASARGVAATTTQTQLTADLDAIYRLGLVGGGNIYWTVIIVKTDPYVRVTQPAVNNSRLLTYQPPAGPDTTPEPPIP
jgi:pilus assembly protein CpaE